MCQGWSNETTPRMLLGMPRAFRIRPGLNDFLFTCVSLPGRLSSVFKAARRQKILDIFINSSDNANVANRFPFAYGLLTLPAVSDIETYDLRTR